MIPSALPHYPHVPGSKGDLGTSQAAAPTKEEAFTLRGVCLAILVMKGPLTADEIAAKLHRSILSIRPRIAELKRLGRIEPTGERRRNASGRNAAVWRAKLIKP